MESGECDEFKLEIDADDDIVANWWIGRSDMRLYQSHDPDDSARAGMDGDKYLQDDIRDAINDLRQGQLEGRPNEIRRLGRNLFRAVYPGKVGELFENAVRRARETKGRSLRVVLTIHPKSRTFGWPMEFLRCDNLGLWLSTEQGIAFSRQPHRSVFSFDAPRMDRLRMLVVVSKPQDLPGVTSVPVMDGVGKWIAAQASDATSGDNPRMDARVLGKIAGYEGKQASSAGIEYLDQPATWETVRQWINSPDWQPDILHFCGHGKCDTEGSLALVKPGNKLDWEADWIGGRDLFDLFSEWKPRLILLQACESALADTDRGFLSIGDLLMESGIPAVVAMQFAITNECASDFASAFYAALRAGCEVDEAVQKGRWKISSANSKRWSTRDFGAPVLVSHKPVGLVRQPSAQAPRFGVLPGRQNVGAPAAPLPEAPRNLQNMVEKTLDCLTRGEIKIACGWMNIVRTQLTADRKDEIGWLDDAIQFLDFNQVQAATETLIKLKVGLAQQPRLAEQAVVSAQLKTPDTGLINPQRAASVDGMTVQ